MLLSTFCLFVLLFFSATALRRFLRCRLLEGDTYKSQSQELLKRLRPEPEDAAAAAVAHVDATTAEVQAARAAVVPWVST